MASTYLNRNASATATTFTYSVWLKRSSLASDYQYFFSYQSSGGGSNGYGLAFNGSTNKMYYYGTGGTATTDAVFRDPSAWYHVVLSVSSGTGTLYVNNETVKSSIAVNQVTSGEGMTIGAYKYGSTIDYEFDGYMAHTHFTDGYAYTPSTFGSTATNGQWVPTLTPSVTYGTNGFFLKFTNASDLGEDFSGNNNDFTKTGSGDKTNDNPENVFASLNPLYKQGSPTFSEGNTKVVLPAGDGTQGAAANFAPPVGKWYWEIKQGSSTNSSIMVREASDKEDDLSYYEGNYAGYEKNDGDQRVTGNTTSVYGAAYTSGDIIMVALDMDNNRVYFGKNGLWADGAGNSNQSSLDDYVPLNGVTNGVPAVTNANGSASATFQFNFGNPAFTISSGNADGNGKGTFEYAPPTNYLALCSDNLSSALTQPIGKGGSYMNTVLYTGNGSNGHAITGVGFQPDLVWLKSRVNAETNWLGDSVRGPNLRLQSNSTNAEFDTGPSGNNYPGVSSFDSDGFTVGRSDAANANGQSMVAWNWRASGSTASNTDGSITSTVSANTTAGFSVLTYTGNETQGATVGHGLGKIPKMIIVKCRSQSDAWGVYHVSVGATKYLKLNETSATTSTGTTVFPTTPTSSLFYLGNSGLVNGNSRTYVAYCFAEIEGYSKMGGFTGNGNSNGPFVYTGFSPAFVYIKWTSGANHHVLYDNAINTYNPASVYQRANDAAADGTSTPIDFLSNGFKIRHTDSAINSSGGSYIFTAFAENPFVDSSGIPVTAR